MLQMNRSIMPHRRLLLVKWLMIFIPPVTVSVGHSLPAGHTVGRLADTLLVGFLALLLAYVFAETVFRVLQKLRRRQWPGSRTSCP